MSNQRFDPLNWNKLWAKADEMDAAWAAIDRGEVATLKRALDANPKMVRWSRLDGLTFLDLFALARNPTEEMLGLLLTRGPFADDGDIHEALRRLCQESGSLRAAELLLNQRANPNYFAGIEISPLSHAVSRNRSDLVALLLQHGADPAWDDGEGRTPLAAAEQLGYDDIASLLMNAGAPRTGRPTRICDPRRPRTKATLVLEAMAPRIEGLFCQAVRQWKQKRRGIVRAIAVSCSGVKGYVRMGFSPDPFDPYFPDCCLDVPMVQELKIPSWENALAKRDRVIVHASGKAKTLSSLCCMPTREKPFFDFVQTLFRKAMQQGVFDSLDTDERTLFGCQDFYFHHCRCWDHRQRRIPVPKVWDRDGCGTSNRTTKCTSSRVDGAEAASRSTPVLIIRKSADHVICDAERSEWILHNTSGLQRVPFGKRTPVARVLVPASFGLCAMDYGNQFCAVASQDDVWVFDVSNWTHVATLRSLNPIRPMLGVARGTWLYGDDEETSWLKLGPSGGVDRSRVTLPVKWVSQIAIHPATNLVVLNEQYHTNIYVGRLTDGKFSLEAEIPFDKIAREVVAILDLAIHPSGFAVGIRYVTEGRETRLALVDAAAPNMLADCLLGVDVLTHDWVWSPDGSKLACQINHGQLRLSPGIFPEDKLVCLNGKTLEYRDHLPVTDISCCAWSPDSQQLMVGGYHECTLWKL